MIAWRHCEGIREGERGELLDVVVSLHAIMLIELVSVVAEEEERVEMIGSDVLLKISELSLSSSCEVLIAEEHDFWVRLTNCWWCGDRHREGVGEERERRGVGGVALETDGVRLADHSGDGEDNGVFGVGYLLGSRLFEANHLVHELEYGFLQDEGEGLPRRYDERCVRAVVDRVEHYDCCLGARVVAVVRSDE